LKIVKELPLEIYEGISIFKNKLKQRINYETQRL